MKIINLSLNSEANALNQWDSGMIVDVLNSEIETSSGLNEHLDRAIVLLPARHHHGLEDEVNWQLQSIDKLVLILLGDEEAVFDIEKIQHPDCIIWVQNPHPGKHDDYFKLGTGYPPHIKREFRTKNLDVFFSGQITHKRRQLLYDALLPLHSDTWHINGTKGFTQGYEPARYFDYMNSTKVVPCPSGAVIPDSFRVFEALECGAIPLLDEVNPSGTITEYWDWLLGPNPLPKYKEPAEVPAKINEILEVWQDYSLEVQAWYIRYKNDLKRAVYEQYNR